ncbi:MAG TPA: methyltransferase domain-containing protein [Pilimelia sp.]|nr:methyltransferase domain-containing protein [Pilimelia sp.]
MSDSTETFQISADQAEIYESRFVPAIFAQWAQPLLAAAGVRPGQAILDVACGTGILARTAADRVGPTGRVVGVDLNEGMLTVARRLRPDIEWRRGDAADLPLPDAAFDAALCQSALMFFPDVTQALREMARVTKPPGTVGVQVYASLDAQPAYGPWVHMVARHAGPEAINLLSTYWIHGDLDVLRKQFKTAGLDITDVRTVRGTARFGSIEQMVRTEVEATPLVDRVSDDVYQRIIDESADILGAFQTDTAAELPLDAHIVTAHKS